jgi:hypothetical protein
MNLELSDSERFFCHEPFEKEEWMIRSYFSIVAAISLQVVTCSALLPCSLFLILSEGNLTMFEVVSVFQ